MTHVAAGRVLAFVAFLTGAGCYRHRPFAEFPRDRSGRIAAIFALRAAECDGNLSALRVFERPAIASGVVLAGVVLVDGDSAEPRLRAQMRAFDVEAPLLRLARTTRDSLARLTDGFGPAIVVMDRARRDVALFHAPQSSEQLVQLTDTLRSLARRVGPPTTRDAR